MIRRLLSAAAIAGVLLVAPAAVPASAAAHSAVVESHAGCTYKRVGNHWNCVTPGAYCPAAAHLKLGYAKVTSRAYRCSRYANGQWRWKRV